jgi:hypothetical protein
MVSAGLVLDAFITTGHSPKTKEPTVEYISRALTTPEVEASDIYHNLSYEIRRFRSKNVHTNVNVKTCDLLGIEPKYPVLILNSSDQRPAVELRGIKVEDEKINIPVVKLESEFDINESCEYAMATMIRHPVKKILGCDRAVVQAVTDSQLMDVDFCKWNNDKVFNNSPLKYGICVLPESFAISALMETLGGFSIPIGIGIYWGTSFVYSYIAKKRNENTYKKTKEVLSVSESDLLPLLLTRKEIHQAAEQVEKELIVNSENLSSWLTGKYERKGYARYQIASAMATASF